MFLFARFDHIIPCVNETGRFIALSLYVVAEWR